MNNWLPVNKLIVVDSTKKPYNLYGDIVYLHTPEAKLGYARNMGYLQVDAPCFMFIDDDIVHTPKDLEKIYRLLYSSEDIAAVSGMVIGGYPVHDNLMKLYEAGRETGYSAGYSIYKTDKIKQVGGLNPDIHIGEDTHLSYLLRSNGYRWIRCKEAKVGHMTTPRQELVRAFRIKRGVPDLWKHSAIDKLDYTLRHFGRPFTMPFYYAAKTRNLRCGLLYAGISFMKLFGLLYYGGRALCSGL